MADRSVKAAKDHGVKTLALTGGVAANTGLRTAMEERAAAEGIEFVCPSFIFCTDNGAMIGATGYIDYMRGIRDDLSLNAIPGLPIGAR